MGGMSSKAKIADPELKNYVESEVKKNQIVVWSKTYCSYCSRTKALFQKPEFEGCTVKVHELDQISNGNAIQSLLAVMTGQRTVPSVWISGQFLGGNDDTQAAYRSGKLQKLLGISSKL